MAILIGLRVHARDVQNLTADLQEESPASQPEPASAPEPAANPNLITRSVASDGPVASGGSNEPEAKSKQRPKFETAKSRRAQVSTAAAIDCIN